MRTTPSLYHPRLEEIFWRINNITSPCFVEHVSSTEAQAHPMPRYHQDLPDEWPVISSYIDEIEQKMCEIENSKDIGIREQERYWPIFHLHRERTKKIYDMYTSGKISKHLYRYCTENFYCDHVLVCYWKKNGYENLCCLRCIQNDSRHGNVCICRVPRKNFGADDVVECDSCGCRGCSGH